MFSTLTRRRASRRGRIRARAATLLLLAFVPACRGCFEDSDSCTFGALQPGECNSDSDCVGAQTCVGAFLGPGTCGGCASHADCAPDEECVAPFLFGESTCRPIPLCTTHADCGACEVCLPRHDGRKHCVQEYGCDPTTSASSGSGGPVCFPEGAACANGETCCAGACDGAICAPPRCSPGAPPDVLAADAPGATTLAQDFYRLYWIAGGEVRAVSKFGGSTEVLASGPYVDLVARAPGRLVFATDPPVPGDPGAIWSLADGEPTPTLLSSTPGAPRALAATNDEAYWTTDESPGPHQLFRVAFGAAGMPELVTVLSDPISPSPVAARGATAYFADGAAVHELAGGVDVLLHQGAGPRIAALTADASTVWFADGDLAYRGDVVAGTAVGAIGRLGAFGDAYFALDASGPGTLVFRVDRSAPVPVVESAGPSAPRGLLADEECVYWIDALTGSVLKAAR